MMVYSAVSLYVIINVSEELPSPGLSWGADWLYRKGSQWKLEPMRHL
jgi:hypothetical protein